jgi:hypothetical protein
MRLTESTIKNQVIRCSSFSFHNFRTPLSHSFLDQNSQSVLIDSKFVILTNHESFFIFLDCFMSPFVFAIILNDLLFHQPDVIYEYLPKLV